TLDGEEGFPGPRGITQIGSAAWVSDRRVILGGSSDHEEPEDELRKGPRVRRNGIATYDIEERRYLQDPVLDGPPGARRPLGQEHVVVFYRHPRLISLRTGRVLHTFDDLDTGLQDGCIAADGEQRTPPMALDQQKGRFAVAQGKRVVVVQFRI